MGCLLDKLVAHDMLGLSDGQGAYAREWEAHKNALQRVEDLDPGLVRGPGISPLSEMDEAVVARVLAAWQRGPTCCRRLGNVVTIPSANSDVCQKGGIDGRSISPSH